MTRVRAPPPRHPPSLPALLTAVRTCTLCATQLPLGPRPVLQMHASARILIASQAPGRKVHATGIPFDDASGERLRAWLGMPRETFYDRRQVAILPMGFCYPGSGLGGDLPPRPECAAAWRSALLARLARLDLTLVIGRYAQAWHLPANGATLTEAVQAWRTHWPYTVALPHPSPRNTPWLKRHPWFERDLLPALQARVQQLLAGGVVRASHR
ncbi:MAG: uracil-DNA glycosylase family protein [Burkholderiaceae bacterium]|nr:uracil-DNA glycosylase family protein [Burkholderiaceae bacterium]